MKKKVKKIPKYYNGELAVGMPDMSNYKIQNRMGIAPSSSSSTISYSGNEDWSDMTNNQKAASVANAIGGGADLINMATSGQNVTAGTALSGIAKGASAGATFGPIGAGVGAALGAIAGTAGRKHGYDKNSASTNFNDIYQEGSGWLSWLGPSSHEAKANANRVQSSNIAKIQTQGIKADYMNNPNVQVQPILAAEGGIMRKPVDALVSKGELIYDPTTKKLRQVPGSKGKPNKKDDVPVRLYEGDVVLSNSPTMLMSNGKTPAQNLEGLIDRKDTVSDGTTKAREAIIKKVVNWQEANKTKPQEYAKFSLGEDEVLNVPIKRIKKDFEFANYDPVAEMKKELDQKTFAPIKVDITGKDPLKHLTKDQRSVLRDAIRIQNGKTKSSWLSNLSDFAPLAAALKNYDYHREQPYINPSKYVSTAVNINPLTSAANESYAMARYNQASISPNTGAGMAYGLQAANNRTKSLRNAYQWQQEQQNKLIAQNVGIYNDWASREAQARHTAAVETAQNEAAAQLMRDQAIKDAYEFQTGRRNDRWKLSMLEPLMKYAVDDNIWKNFKIA